MARAGGQRAGWRRAVCLPEAPFGNTFRHTFLQCRQQYDRGVVLYLLSELRAYGGCAATGYRPFRHDRVALQ